jgi:hypothetical protein
MKGKELTRRDFIKGVAFTGTGLALGSNLLGKLDALAQGKIYLPLILKAPTPPPSKVVHVHDSGATNWTGSGWYGDHVSQSTVNTMVENGLKELTGYSTWSDIWAALFSKVNGSGYQPGQKIAIKVNFNNSNEGCGDSDNTIDALPQPVNALIAGLKQAGVQEQDIWIYDATRGIPDRFRSRIPYTNVMFYDGGGVCTGNEARFNTANSAAKVTFHPPSGVSVANEWVTEVVMNATYLINMPIMKDHGISGVTLGFKNHFGTIQNPYGLHPNITINGSQYRSDYNPMVDIYRHPAIGDKTILTIGDGLYGALENTNVTPKIWTTFGNDYPNSLFFSTDPVAIDCVMLDILHAEPGSHPYKDTGKVDDYLKLASSAGLGVHERGDPWQTPYGSGYSQIIYARLSS